MPAPRMFDLAAVAEAFPEFEVIEELGRGGNKVAFRIRRDGQDLVLKVLLTPLSAFDDEDEQAVTALARVRRELDGMRSLSSPRIAQILEEPEERSLAGEEHLCYLEPYYSGGVLTGQLSKPWPADKVVQLMVQLVEAVEYLWNKNLVHRDIKPDNIVFDSEGNLVLLDLGAALFLELTSLTEPYAVAPMTRAYAAPEQFQPRQEESLDFRTDLFAIGLVAFEALTGKQPYAPAVAGHAQRLAKGNYDSKALDDAPAPEELKVVIRRLIAPRRNQRYRTLEQLKEAIRGALE